MYMKHPTNKWFYVLALGAILFSMPPSLDAQSDCPKRSYEEKVEWAKKESRHLAKGFLLIELRDQKKQLAALDSFIAKKNLTEGQRKRFEEEKERRMDENRKWRENLHDAFSEYYSFNQVLFYNKSDRDSIHSLEKPWVDRTGNHFVQDVDFDNYMILTPGQTKNQGLEAYILLTPERKTFCSPFPTYFRLNTFSSLFKWGDEGDTHRAEKLAIKVHNTFVQMSKGRI